MSQFPDFYRLGPAPCTKTDPDLFFPEPDAPRQMEKIEIAKQDFCNKGCVYKAECLEWGIENDEPGIWGGATRNERKAMRRARRLVSISMPTFPAQR